MKLTNGVVALWKLLDKVAMGHLGRANDLLPRRVRMAVCDVVVDCPAEQDRILGDDADTRAPRLGNELADVLAVKGHGPYGGVVEPEEQELDRRLAATATTATPAQKEHTPMNRSESTHTRATHSPLLIRKLRPSRTLACGREGYAKVTSRSSIAPFLSTGTGAPMDSGIGEGKALRPMIRCDAPTPFMRPVKNVAKADAPSAAAAESLIALTVQRPLDPVDVDEQ